VALPRFGWKIPAWWLAVVVLVIALAIRAIDPSFVEGPRLHGFDMAQRLWPRGDADDDRVMIVGIDEKSLAAKGQWPWPRTLIAELVRRIAAGQPGAFGLDILLAEPDRYSPQRIAESVPDLPADVTESLANLPESDALLGETIGTVPTVLVAYPSRQELPRSAGPQPLKTYVREQGNDPRRFLFKYASLIRSLPAIAQHARGEGAAAVKPDIDGVVRRVPLVVLAEGRLVPALAVASLGIAQRQSSTLITAGAQGVERVTAGDFIAPTDSHGQAILYFAPPAHFPFFAAVDVLKPTFDAQQFAGRIVLLGVTGAGIVDRQPTPLGLMDGVLLHAQLTQSILDGSLLRRPPIVLWIELAVILLAGAVPIWLIGFGRPFIAATAVLGLAAALIGGELALFRFAGFLIDGLFAAMTAVATFGIMLMEHLRALQAARRALDVELAQQRERNARLAGELEAARSIQMGLLPRRFPVFTERDDIDLFAHIEPAREVGGDLFVFSLVGENLLFFMIGDVSGKGMGAALFMAMTREVVLDAARRYGSALDQMLGEANVKIAAASADMAQEGGDMMFVTALAGILDLASGEVVFASAGHDAPFLVRAGAPPRRLETEGGPPLGVMEGFAFPVDRDHMDVGEVLLLYTDGVTEAMNGAQTLYGTERLAAVLAASLAKDARSVVDAVTEDVRAFAAGAEQADDIALLALRRSRAASAWTGQ
jgi:adenylate cyclase